MVKQERRGPAEELLPPGFSFCSAGYRELRHRFCHCNSIDFIPQSNSGRARNSNAEFRLGQRFPESFALELLAFCF